MQDQLKTERLLLRRLRPADAPAIRDLAGNWQVARMTARIPHPYPADLAAPWVGEQEEAWGSGAWYVFALERNGRLIGSVGLHRTKSGRYELGYWIGEPWWGQGFATEAALEAVRFAFEELKVDRLTSGHFTDNPASGRVLAKCGFRDDGTETLWCEARGEHLTSHRLVLPRNAAGAQGQPS